MFTKVIRPGSVPVYGDRRADVFCKIELSDDGRLSISGVIGPKSNGDAIGSCGQIVMGFAHRNPADDDKRYSDPIRPDQFEFAPGWDAERWLTFLDAWSRWHLNDMRAGCEHQRGPEWESREITLYHFRLKKSVAEARRAAEKRAKSVLKTGETFAPTDDEVRVCTLPDQITLDVAELPPRLAGDYEPNGPQYNGDIYNRPSETKQSNWVRADEHPAGVLSKPCPVCGYKYGTAWKREEVPADVIKFLESLPSADKHPAWV